MRDWVVANYADRIRCLWASMNPAIRSIALNIRPATASPAVTEKSDPPAAAVAVAVPEAAATGPLDELGARIDARFTFERFVVGKPNEFAVAAAERVSTLLETSVQSALPLWRRGARQDPPDACHRLAREAA